MTPLSPAISFLHLQCSHLDFSATPQWRLDPQSSPLPEGTSLLLLHLWGGVSKSTDLKSYHCCQEASGTRLRPVRHFCELSLHRASPPHSLLCLLLLDGCCAPCPCQKQSNDWHPADTGETDSCRIHVLLRQLLEAVTNDKLQRDLQ